MANIKFIAVSRSLSGILDYVTNREKTVERLISGVNCMSLSVFIRHPSFPTRRVEYGS